MLKTRVVFMGRRPNSSDRELLNPRKFRVGMGVQITDLVSGDEPATYHCGQRSKVLHSATVSLGHVSEIHQNVFLG